MKIKWIKSWKILLLLSILPRILKIWCTKTTARKWRYELIVFNWDITEDDLVNPLRMSLFVTGSQFPPHQENTIVAKLNRKLVESVILGPPNKNKFPPRLYPISFDRQNKIFIMCFFTLSNKFWMTKQNICHVYFITHGVNNLFLAMRAMTYF